MAFIRYLPIWVSAVLGGSLLAFVLMSGQDSDPEVDSILTPAPTDEVESVEPDEPVESIAEEETAPDQEVLAEVEPERTFGSGLFNPQDLIRGRIGDRLDDLTGRR